MLGVDRDVLLVTFRREPLLRYVVALFSLLPFVSGAMAYAVTRSTTATAGAFLVAAALSTVVVASQVRSFAATHQQRGMPDDADLADVLREHQPDPDAVDPDRWDDPERRAAVEDLQAQVRRVAADSDLDSDDDVVALDGVGGLDDLPDEDPLEGFDDDSRDPPVDGDETDVGHPPGDGDEDASGGDAAGSDDDPDETR
jgi:hypothetical protein